MELKNRPKKSKRKLKGALFLSATISLFVLLALIALGPRYKAEGLIFISSPASSDTEQKYTYGGYYSQQKSASFTNNIPGMLSSKVFIAEVLKEQGGFFDERNITREKRSIRISLEGPQLVGLAVYKNTSLASRSHWNSFYGVLERRVAELSNSSGQTYVVEKAGESPLVIKVPRYPLAVSLGVFFISNAVFYTTLLLAEYLRKLL